MVKFYNRDKAEAMARSLCLLAGQDPDAVVLDPESGIVGVKRPAWRNYWNRACEVLDAREGLVVDKARELCRAAGQNPDEPDYDTGQRWRRFIVRASRVLDARNGGGDA